MSRPGTSQQTRIERRINWLYAKRTAHRRPAAELDGAGYLFHSPDDPAPAPSWEILRAHLTAPGAWTVVSLITAVLIVLSDQM